MKTLTVKKLHLLLTLVFLLALGSYDTLRGQNFTHFIASVSEDGDWVNMDIGFEGEADMFQYARVGSFSPCEGENPETHGTMTVFFLDFPIPHPIQNLTPGYYAFAVRARIGNIYTDWYYSNVIFKGVYELTLIFVDDTYNPMIPIQCLLQTVDVCGVDATVQSMYDLDQLTFRKLMPGAYSLSASFEDYPEFFLPSFSIHSDTTIQIILTGLENNRPVQTGIFPNPAHDVITIMANSIIQSVSITDIQGKLFIELNGNGTKRLDRINVSALPTGIYSVQINTAAQFYTSRLIVQ